MNSYDKLLNVIKGNAKHPNCAVVILEAANKYIDDRQLPTTGNSREIYDKVLNFLSFIRDSYKLLGNRYTADMLLYDLSVRSQDLTNELLQLPTTEQSVQGSDNN